MELLMMHVVVRPAKRTEFLQAVQKILARSREWRGCRKCVVCHSSEDGNDFHLMEQWDSRADLKAYVRSRDFRALLGAMKVLGQAREVRIFSNGMRKREEPMPKPRGHPSVSEGSP